MMEVKMDNCYTKNGSSNKIETFSLTEMKHYVDWAIENVKKNKKDPNEIPVFIDFDGKKCTVGHFSVGYGTRIECSLESSDYYEVKFIAPDSRPEEGEYWKSRGIGGSDKHQDCSGFVVSKAAGERLRRMVRLVLEKDETESWLDFRESEPNWIQFKFQGSEFDLRKLEQLAEEKGNVVTLEILKQCKK